MKRIRIALCVLWALTFNAVSAQYVGGFSPGEMPSAKVEKSSLSGGPVAANVNMFTGTLEVSYDLGNVSTISGLSFPLRLSFSSRSLQSFETEVNQGIPYGEGWTLSEAAITVENYAFHFEPGDLQKVQNIERYTVNDALKVGESYFGNVQLSLPGGISGHLVYKYPHPSRENVFVYVLEGFDQYVEALLIGDHWEVYMPDGTIYHFGLRQTQFRNPNNVTAQLENIPFASFQPKAATSRWHLTQISNPNHGNGQKIQFEYEVFGDIPYYHEIRQSTILDWLHLQDFSSGGTIVGSTGQGEYIVEYDPPRIGPGGVIIEQEIITGTNLIMAPFDETGVTKVKSYSDVILSKVTATDGLGQIMSEADLVYHTEKPADHLSAAEQDNDRTMEINGTNVYRIDSMYSRKTVWFRGTDVFQSQLNDYNGRPDMSTQYNGKNYRAQFDQDWSRYQHPAAYQNKLSRFQGLAIKPTDPFAMKFGTWLPNPPLGYSVAADYRMRERALGGLPSGSLPFTHSVLESERLNNPEWFVEGDLYELRTTIKRPDPFMDANIDLQIVSGYGSDEGLHWADAGNSGKDYWMYPQQFANAQNYTNQGFSSRSYPVFSTFGNLLKWNPTYQDNSLYMTTRNPFRMPNLPQEFEGFHIQVGPGQDNLVHGDGDEVGDAYPNFFENKPTAIVEKDRELQVTSWFGTGAPLQPMYAGEHFDVTSGTNTTRGTQTADRQMFWHYPLHQSIASGNLQWPNQPTAMTIEHVSSGLSGNYAFQDQSMENAHGLADEMELLNVELVRIARNTYMLDSVIFYVQHGSTDDLVAVAAYKLHYDIEQVPVFNNVATDKLSDPDFAGKFTGNRYKRYTDGSGTRKYAWRNIWQLAQIERLETDTVGNIAQSIAHSPTTYFNYYVEDTNTVMISEAYLLHTIQNELGGYFEYEYDLNAVDTTFLNASQGPSFYNLSNDMIGRGAVVELRVPVKHVLQKDENAVMRQMNYTFQNLVTMRVTYELDDHFKGKYGTSRSVTVFRKGYEKAIAEKVSLNTNPGPQQARTEYTHYVANNNAQDRFLFGRVIKVEDFDDQGRLISRQESEYEITQAFPSGWDHANVTPFEYSIGDQYNITLPYESAYLHTGPEAEQTQSYFVHLKSQDQVTRDPNNTRTVSSHTDFTYYDWLFDATHDRTDSDLDYVRMYNPNLATTNYFQVKAYYDCGANCDYTYWEEPSWNMASATTTYADKPGAYDRQEFYFLWDAGPFLGTDGNHPKLNGSNDDRLDLTYKPFYLARKYSIRSTPYEIRKITHNGDPNKKAYSQSEFYWMDIFRDVPGDLFVDVDSTNYGRTCGDGFPVDIKNLTAYCLGDGKPVSIERLSNEIVDDPRYVQTSTGWYLFDIVSVSGMSLDDWGGITNGQTSGFGSCGGGFAVGPIGSGNEVRYFGTLPLASGGSIASADIIPADRNYGKESLTVSPVSDESRQKLALLVELPHLCPGSDTLCTVQHVAANDSVLNASITEAGTGGTPGDDTGPGGPGERQLFIDLLQNQFYLRAIYVQADSIENQFAYVSELHHPLWPSFHNIWQVVDNPDPIVAQSDHIFDFQPRVPTIRTYKVHQRNMHGQVVEDEDVRHLHRVFEYSKGYYKQWWDKCGVPHTYVERKWYGLPLSVTQTDFGPIEHVTIFTYNKDNSLRRAITPTREKLEYLYDGYGRLVESILNGVTRETYEYSMWDGVTNGFFDIAEQNYVRATTVNDGNTPDLYSTAYIDPLGRSWQTVLATGRPGLYDKRFAGKLYYDTWDRAIKAHRPYGRSLQPDINFDPSPILGAYSESTYEHDSRSRMLEASKPGNALGGPHTAHSNYSIITLGEFKTETGATGNEIKMLFPQVLIAGYQSSGPLPGNSQAVIAPASLNGIKLFRTESIDEDGKNNVQYADVQGRAVATLGHTGDGQGDEVLTMMVYDHAGRVTRIIHPHKLHSVMQYNYMGWTVLSTTPDAGTVALMYNQAGDARIKQDENLRNEGRVQISEVDRMGRVVRVKSAEIGSVATQAGTVSPFDFGVGVPSTHSIIDELWTDPFADANYDLDVWTTDYAAISFPKLSFPESNVELESEVRWDHAVDSTVPNTYFVPDVASGLLHPLALQWVFYDPGQLRGRVSMEKTYSEGQLIELSFFGYNPEGQPSWTVRQFRKEGITESIEGDPHLIEYKDYDNQGRLLAYEVDAYMDGEVEIRQEYEYDGFGQMTRVFARPSEATVPVNPNTGRIAEYTYDVGTGLVTDLRYYVNGEIAGGMLNSAEVDHMQFAYDLQDRMTGYTSRYLDFNLYFDGNVPGGGITAPGVPQVNYDENWNGGINGWRANYKLSGTGASGFASPTVYGFAYDDLNRLLAADASIANSAIAGGGGLGGGPSSWNNGGNFGTPLTSTNAYWQGDVKYSYDKAGNLLGLRRYKWYKAGAPTVGDKGDNRTYHYTSGTNRLERLSTTARPDILLTYDDNGNIESDSKRGLGGFEYDNFNMPTALHNGNNDDITYMYGSGRQRVYKQVHHAGSADITSDYYLRDAMGRTMAILTRKSNDADNDLWTFELYGNDLIAEWYCKDTTVQQGGTPNGPPQQRIEPKKGKGKAALKNILSTLISSLPGLAPAVTKGEIPQDEKMAAVGITLAPVIHEGVDRLIDKVDEWIGPGAAKIGEDSSEEPYIDSLKFFVKDHLGNVRVTYIAEFDGTVGAGAATHELQSVIDYYPYGKQLRAWFRGDEERFQSTLHERDAETGLDMRGARYYDSDYGRFLSLDPLAADFMAWSPYVYAIDNPVVFFDPNGKAPEYAGEGDQTGGGGDGEYHPKRGRTTSSDFSFNVGFEFGLKAKLDIQVLGAGAGLEFGGPSFSVKAGVSVNDFSPTPSSVPYTYSSMSESNFSFGGRLQAAGFGGGYSRKSGYTDFGKYPPEKRVVMEKVSSSVGYGTLTSTMVNGEEVSTSLNVGVSGSAGVLLIVSVSMGYTHTEVNWDAINRVRAGLGMGPVMEKKGSQSQRVSGIGGMLNMSVVSALIGPNLNSAVTSYSSLFNMGTGKAAGVINGGILNNTATGSNGSTNHGVNNSAGDYVSDQYF